MKRLLLSAMVAAAFVLTVGWATCNRFVVTNESGRQVCVMTVEVCGETFRFVNVPPGATVSARFETPASESGFYVETLSDDGTRVNENCGYVVWEDYAQRFNLTLGPNGEVNCR